MSLAQIKNFIEERNCEERLDLAAWIAHLNHGHDPEYVATLEARMAAKDAGRKVAAAGFARVDIELRSKRL